MREGMKRRQLAISSDLFVLFCCFVFLFWCDFLCRCLCRRYTPPNIATTALGAWRRACEGRQRQNFLVGCREIHQMWRAPTKTIMIPC